MISFIGILLSLSVLSSAERPSFKNSTFTSHFSRLRNHATFGECTDEIPSDADDTTYTTQLTDCYLNYCATESQPEECTTAMQCVTSHCGLGESGLTADKASCYKSCIAQNTGGGGTGSTPDNDDVKDCKERCKDEFSDASLLQDCENACTYYNGKGPFDGNSECKDKVKSGTHSNDSDGEKMCDAICPASKWWIYLIIGLAAAIVIAVVVVVIVVVVLKKKKNGQVSPASDSASSQSVQVTVSDPPSD